MNLYFLKETALLELRHIFGQKKFFLLAFLLVLPVGLMAWIVSQETQFKQEETAFFAYYLLYPQVLCILLCALYGTALMQREVQDKTLTYIITTPVPRYVTIFGKYIGIVVSMSAMTCASFLISFFIGYPSGTLRFVLGFCSGIFFSIAMYTAIFCLFGFMFPRRALTISIVFSVVEFIISFVPAVVNKLLPAFYVRSFLFDAAGRTPPERFRELYGDMGMIGSGLGLLIASVVCLAASALLYTYREYTVTEQV